MDVMRHFYFECCTLQDAQVRTNAFITLLKLRFLGIMPSELNQPNVVEDLADVWQKFETADRRAEELKNEASSITSTMGRGGSMRWRPTPATWPACR